MFRGLNTIILDDKGRMTIPTRYRTFVKQEAESKLVITIDTEVRCLLLYPQFSWELIEKKLESLPSFNRSARRIQRLLVGHATEIEMDAQGRLLIPPPLREYAGLIKSITLVGQGKKFEIWDEGHWNETRKGWLEEGLDVGNPLPSEFDSLSL